MLELASKVFFKTNDSRFKTRNTLSNADNGQIFDLADGKDISQLDTTPRNINIFNNAVQRWEQHAQVMGAAGESLLGETPTSGTPFKLYEAQLIENKSLHIWRRGKIAVFLDEIYRDWILPKIYKEIVKGDKFAAELSMDELEQVMNAIIDKKAFEFEKERVLSGQLVLPEQTEQFKQKVRASFLKGGKKHFIEILKDEFKDEPLEIKTNIANKQKNLALITDKLTNVLRQFISTPQIRQDPEMVKLLNTILESSGLSPIMFSTAPKALPAPMEQGGGTTQPLQALGRQMTETATA